MRLPWKSSNSNTIKMQYFDFRETFYMNENPVTVAIFDNDYKYCLEDQFENECCKFHCNGLSKTRMLKADKAECGRCLTRDSFMCSN